MKTIKVELGVSDSFVPGNCSICPFAAASSVRGNTYAKMTGEICSLSTLSKDSIHCPAVICDDSKRDN